MSGTAKSSGSVSESSGGGVLVPCGLLPDTLTVEVVGGCADGFVFSVSRCPAGSIWTGPRQAIDCHLWSPYTERTEQAYAKVDIVCFTAGQIGGTLAYGVAAPSPDCHGNPTIFGVESYAPASLLDGPFSLPVDLTLSLVCAFGCGSCGCGAATHLVVTA